MITSEKRLNFLTTIHNVSLLNFSPVLSQVSQTEFLVMSAIKRLGGVEDVNSKGICGIAESLNVSSPAISRTVTALENRNLAERYIDKSNRRSTNVRLTSLGEAVYYTESERIHCFANSVLEKMGEDRLDELFSLCSELFTAVKEELLEKQNEQSGV